MAKSKKIPRSKKLVRVLRRKWFKPALYTISISYLIYLGISNAVIQKKVIEEDLPRFMISRLSDKFEETEFSHLLLTVQEINKRPELAELLKDYANRPYPSAVCPKLLEQNLNRMNWEAPAFLIRIKKLFSMYDSYDHLKRLNATIDFLAKEIKERRLPKSFMTQIDLLQKERDDLLKKELTPEEYKFIEDYGGIVQKLKIEE